MEIITPPYMDISKLLERAVEIAKEKADGHLTIMKFTTHWKVMIRTPDLTGGDGREEVERLRPFHCLHDALYDLIEREGNITENGNKIIKKNILGRSMYRGPN